MTRWAGPAARAAARFHRKMSTPRKVIITCAVTGAIHTPSMSPHLPITPDQIIADALGAAEAGAAILHLHARDPATGKSVHVAAGAHHAGGSLQARGRILEYGLDEFRPVPSPQPLQGFPIRLGARA